MVKIILHNIIVAATTICVLGGDVAPTKLGIIGGNPTNIRKHPYLVSSSSIFLKDL